MKEKEMECTCCHKRGKGPINTTERYEKLWKCPSCGKVENITTREPPVPIKKELRQEVGFGCPVPDCGNPYLQWHHFDPPWREHKQHDLKGMVALCAEHHAKADAGTYTKEQLQKFKAEGAKNNEIIKGRFDWMRNDILTVVGGQMSHNSHILVSFYDKPAIWVNRDENGYLLLNVKMMSISDEPRLLIQDNCWISGDNAQDIECPPNGKLLEIKYENGDKLKIEFREIKSIEAFKKRYPGRNSDFYGIKFPITVIEVFGVVADANVKFNPKETKIGEVTIRKLNIDGFNGINIGFNGGITIG